MLKLVSDAYKMYLKNFPIILLYALPLLVITIISRLIGTSETVNQGMLYFYYISFVLIPIVSVATDICLYRRFFGFSILNPFSNLKSFLLYLIVALALSVIVSTPIIVLRYLINALGISYFASFVIALILNTFIGIYLIARFSILFPLIVQNKVPSLKQFSEYTARSYKQWMLVAALIYTPYVIIYYAVSCPLLNTIAINLFAFVFICFNIQFINNYRVPTAKTASTPKIEPNFETPAITSVDEEKKVVKKKPAPKKTSTTKPKSVKKQADKKQSPKSALKTK